MKSKTCYWEIDRRMLCHVINDAIEQSINGLQSTQEPDYIAALATKLPSKLAAILNGFTLQNTYKVGGCFIHQKPLAKFSSLNGKNPELGDLLIVYKEINGQEVRHNALLLQAKKVNNIYLHPIPNNEKHQLQLYTKWPKFEYARAGILNGKQRSILPKTVTSGAQYLLISDDTLYEHCCCCCDSHFWCAIPNEHLSASNSFAHQLVHLLEFKTGRPFSDENSIMEDWSQMIWDLLSISANSVFNRTGSGYKKQPRYSGDALSFLLGNNDNNINFKEDVNTDQESVGISVICIEVNMSENDINE